MDNECPFCGSARTEGPILKEGDHAYVIFSNPRLMPGHLLVIPKRHIDGRIEELSKEERDEVLNFLSEFQAKILDKIASGCDIRQNYKPFVKDSRIHVDHMHWHLQPRDFNDEIYEKADVYRDPLYVGLSAEERNRLFAILKD